MDIDSVKVKPKLFAVNVIQPKDDLEEKLEKCHSVVVSLVSGLSEREIHDALNQAVCKGIKEHEEVSLGLLFTILTEQLNAPKAYRDLSFISNDGLTSVINKLHQILSEKFQKLLEVPKAQLLWLLGEMMKNHVQNLDSIIHLLLRQIAGGDVSATNIWLIENILKLMKVNRGWLEKNPSTLQLFIFTFIRVIEDHDGARFKALRQNEVEFCVQLIRDRFQECIQIGRDFIRLLQNLYRIPEFTKLWRDIIHKPQSLTPQFNGLPQILNIRTSRKFLACRVTPDMENKLAFLALKVRFGQQRRYQDWFFRQYLSTTESQTLLPDLVRFICGVIHPPNEILGSEVIPRWAILGWLYTACQNPVSQSNTKLALFYDWLFFQGDKDNIMNIEPAMLLMHNSVRTHPNITYSLLDFICRMSTNYCPKFVNITKQGLFLSFRNLLDKRVISSLSPIIKNSRMDKEMKQLINETLPSFVGIDKIGSVSDDPSKLESPPSSPTTDLSKDFNLNTEQPSGNQRSVSPTAPPTDPLSDESCSDGAVFSDEDDEDKPPPPPPLPPPLPTPDTDKKDKIQPPLPAPPPSSFRPITIKEEDFEIAKADEGFVGDDITELDEFQNLDSNLLKDNVLKLKTETCDSSRTEAMEAIISNIESMGDFDEEISGPLCVCLANCLMEDVSLPVFTNENITQELIDASLEKPHHVIFRTICSLSKNDVNRENLYALLNGIHEIEQKMGYQFLFFIKACYKDEEKLSQYEDYIGFFKDRTLKTVLTQDLKACYEYDPILFMYLIESIFKKFSDIAVGNKDIIKMLVTTVHPDEMNSIISKILLGEITIIGENQVGTLLEASLSWSCFEQSCLWQLIDAEETPIEMLVGILGQLTQKKHTETLNHLMLQIRAESPQPEVLKPMFCLDLDGLTKNVSVCLLKTWCQDDPRDLAVTISHLLTKPTQNTGKRKTSSSRLNPSKEQILLHLNQFYKYCQGNNDMAFFNHEALRYAVMQTKKNIADPELKTKCKPLFSEFAELPDRVTRKRKNQRTTRGRVKKEESSDESASDEDEESGDESEEDIEEVKERSRQKQSRPPTKKRRKPSKQVSSDEEDE